MDKIKRMVRRKRSIRKRISGTAEKPRMSVYKSNRNIYVQVIDDIGARTLCSASTQVSGKKNKTCTNINFASALGEKIAKDAAAKGIKRIVFDRSGYLYHGVVKAIADAARKNGLEF